MITRKNRSVWQVWQMLGIWCLLVLLAPASVRGEGSISFDGTSPPSSGGTAKLKHDTAWLVVGKQVTICAWLYAEGQGEENEGVAFAIDEATGSRPAAATQQRRRCSQVYCQLGHTGR